MRLVNSLSLILAGSAFAQQLEWQAALSAFADTSVFTSIEALPDGGAGVPARAFACGHFVDDFNIGPGAPLINPAGRDGIVFRMTNTPPWDVAWKAQAASSDTVILRDLSIDPDGEVLVCGFYVDNVQFTGSGLSFSSPGDTVGFVARLDPDTGDWLDAYETPGILPVSLVAGPADQAVITGPGTLAARFDSGSQTWSTPAPAATDSWHHIAVDPQGEFAYVLTELPHASSNDISLDKLDLGLGGTIWKRRMGSPGVDTPGGLDVAPDGDIRVTWASNHPQPRFEADPVPGIPNIAATHSSIGRIHPDGFPLWLAPVGIAQAPGVLTTSDLDIDAAGNAWLATRFNGNWFIEDQVETGNADSALVAVDGTGDLYDFHRSTGAATENANAVAAPVRDLAILVGEYSGNGTTFAPLPTFPNQANPQGFVAIAAPVPNQQLYVFRPAGGAPPTLLQLTNLLEQSGLQTYVTVANSSTEISVSAYATPSQINDLDPNPNLTWELESFLAANGTNTDAGWALARLNDPSSPSPYTFDFPDTGGEVVVYLIDTAVDELGGWFSANSNLSIAGSTLIRGAGDPTTSSTFEHGTQALSVIAGPDNGAAAGTPIILVNYDIYPDGITTTSALLADAILEVLDDHADNYPCTPAVIGIASSSTDVATSASLSIAMSLATADGIPIVLSAGNASDDAALYVPQAYAGAGILCVGASDLSNIATSISNYGSPVDLHAPGDAVRSVLYTAPFSGSYDTFTGTSASSALVTAIAAVHLSVNPWQSPTELEAAILAETSSGTIDLAQLSSGGPSFSGSFTAWANWHGLATVDTAADSDGDGLDDGLEFVLGFDPCTSDSPSPLDITYSGGTSEISFTISAVLHDSSSPGTLRDGTTWEMTSCTDLSSWSTASGSYSFGSSRASRIPVTLTDTPTTTSCFHRLEISFAP
ncbi:peptidase S8 subtilisin [Haloferula helveola]|uniref:Peptidase S8 subtilisin n=1 Tax=Haloferula helveola TaxID=490095 RepID=A0ABM7RAC2_9BACT|nr:peptidase S8 subtilisin [Haloferula helveola]